MRKDFDGAGWAASHTEDFQQLIANARRKKAVPAEAAGALATNGSEEHATEEHARYLLDAAESPVEEEGSEPLQRKANDTGQSRTIADSIVDSDEGGLDSLGGSMSPNKPLDQAIHATSATTSPHFIPPSGKKRMFDDVQDRAIDVSGGTPVK